MSNLATPSHNLANQSASLPDQTHSTQKLPMNWFEVSTMLDTLTKEAVAIVSSSAACLYIFDQQRTKLLPYFSSSAVASPVNFVEQELGQGPAGWAAKTQRPVRTDSFHSADFPKLITVNFSYNSALALPITGVKAEQPVGVLLVIDKIDAPAFLSEDEQCLQALLSQSGAAQAIKSTILSRHKPDWIEALNTLNQISLVLNTSLHAMDVDEVCRDILQMSSLKHIFQYDIAEICLWDAQTRTLTTAMRLPDDNINVQRYDHTYRLNQGYTGWIAAQQKSLLISDTHTYRESLPKAGLADFPFRSYVGAPLKIGAKLLGTIELAAAPINLYDHTDVALLEVVANHSAVAIDHARLFQQTQRHLTKLSVLFDTSRELSANLSYEELLRDTSSRIAEMFRADECALYSFDETAAVLTLVEQSVKVASTQPEDTQRYASRSLDQNSPWLTVAKFPALQDALKAHTSLVVRVDDPPVNEYELEWLTQKNYAIMVAIPIISREKVMGLIQLFSADPAAFTEDDIWLAQSLINQVSIALENARLFNLTDQQLQKRVNELAGLQRVSSELNSTLDLNHILDLVLEEATRVTLADFGSVNLYDAKTNRLVAHKEQGRVSKTRSVAKTTTRLQTISFSTTQDITKRALRTGTAILIADVSKERSNIGVGRNVRSKAAVPIFYRGEPVGVISLESRQPNFFTDDQLRYLEALANQAAVAIGNTQAYLEQKRERERANRRAEQLTRLSEISDAFLTNRPLLQILEDIAFAIAESVGYQVVLISLIEGNPPIIQPKVGVGIPVTQLQTLRNSAPAYPSANLQAVMQEEFRLGNSYFVPAERASVWQDKLDVPQIEYSRPASQPLTETERLAQGLFAEKSDAWQAGDVLFVPLSDTQNQLMGLLTVENPDTDERPDNLLVQTLEIFANHAAAAIENLRLFEMEKQRRRLTDTLRGVAEAISAQLNFDELLNTVFQKLAEVIEYDSANLQLLQEDQLVIAGGRGWPDSQQVIGLSFSMAGNNPGRQVVETQEPLMIGDVRLAYPEAFGHPPHDWIRSWLGVPLTYGINVLGLVAVDSTQIDFFTREDAEVLLAFANQVAVAWQNAHLFEQAKKQVRQLAALTDVAQSLNRALDLNEVLNLVMDAIFDLVGYSKGSIWLIDHSSNTVKIADTKNVPDFLVELFNESAISVDSEPFATVITTGHELVIRGSTAKDEIANYGSPIPDDVTYVPLKTEDGVIGILAIETVIRDREMLKLVNTLADLAAVAIDSARMLEDTRQRANEMQHLYRLGVEVSGLLDVRQVMRSVVGNALTLTHTQIGAILFWDEENKGYLIDGALNTESAVAQLILNEAKESFEIEASNEAVATLWSGLTRHIMEAGQPMMIIPAEQPGLPSQNPVTDLPILKRPLPLGVRTILGAPIQVQNQSSGAIFVCTLTWRNFDEREVQLLSFVANQAAVAISNAQLVRRLNLITEELERRVSLRTEELAKTLEDLTEERDRVEALYQITRELSASLDLDRVLAEALSLINRAVGISHGAILLFDHETGALIYRAALGRDRPLPRGGLKTPYRPGYGLAGKIIESRQPRIVPELLADPDWIISSDSGERASALAVPLITSEDVLGVLMLFHPELDYFTEDHLKLVTAAGSQIATAMNNAELYRLITDQAQRLGTMLRTQAAETAKNQAILRGIADGVIVLDAHRITALVNPKAAQILSLSTSELENRSIYQSLGQLDDSEERQLARLFYQNLLSALATLEAGEPSAEFRIEADKSVVAVTLASVTLAADEQPSVIAVLRDISKEAEIERIKNEFISTVSHELRTPMTSIKGYADLLVSGSSQVGELNPIQRRFIQIIQSNANRLTGLVNDILEISRIETGRVKLEFEALELPQTIREVAESFEGQRVKKAMHLSLDLAESLPRVYADKARVTQILVNLIGNAWQYTPENGQIIVHAKRLNEDFVQIDVEDTGIGIVEEDLPFIFDRFFRSERTEVQVVDGTGLGLSITKMFVEMLGGAIEVKSTLDVGTTFSFTLPVEPASSLHQLDKIYQRRVKPVENPQALIVDDNPAVIDLLQPHLEQIGYRVSIVTEPGQALSLAHQMGEELQFIFLSLMLENGQGFSILEQLKQDALTAKIPITLSSLFVTPNDRELSLELIDYISTSFAEAEVLERVRQVLNGVGLGRVLVVDDNRETVQWLKNILDGGGYKVQRAFNSQQALDVVAVTKPDLILVNVNMADQTGERISAQLRRSAGPAYMPLIGITEKRVPPQHSQLIEILGSKDLLKKKQPLSSEALEMEIMRMAQRGVAGVMHE
ncbi:MAG: GAF domain-containing protein [Anaerolineae bacterium]